MKKNIGVILAGGSGKRMGNIIPKQFLIIAGKTVLEHTLGVFENHPLIDEIALVIAPAHTEMSNRILQDHPFKKLVHILHGGQERYHSTLSALKAYAQTDCNILIHDAVRPLVDPRIISDVVGALQEVNAVNVAVPATDTIIEVDEKQEYIVQIPDRSRLFNVQTPQGFDRETLQRAFEKALKDPLFQTTDDCGVIKKYLPEEKIRLVHGNPRNIKLTWPEDIAFAEKWLSMDKI
ncbi:2-C-methyl-D-erythritol 4-phosphate cytidylyltransferase [uncultured Odoribacter sp.]|uniref:2-C-methyl-D-erythritol 4-phosphate cytidylyltransferase n=1 Tax=uncultured Odoribacter sp. TaxID=876416 RepID=UPI00262432B4|nr:2-C-methyl-D-erythritol 4-phosphate cytidylyltransferase [uncultured Odoribacter sp.]